MWMYHIKLTILFKVSILLMRIVINEAVTIINVEIPVDICNILE